MKPNQLVEVTPNYAMPPVVAHDMELSFLDHQVLDRAGSGFAEQAFSASYGDNAMHEPTLNVRISFPASVYGRSEAGNYELQRVETARDLGNVALGRAGIAVASAGSYININAQGALKSSQAAFIARQEAEMFRNVNEMMGFDDELGFDGKKKKRKKATVGLAA